MAKIRIILADDHTLFRQGIRTLISAEADMEVVGEAANGVHSPCERPPDRGRSGQGTRRSEREDRRDRDECALEHVKLL